MIKPAFHYVSVNGSTDSRKKLFVGYNLGFAHTEVENGGYRYLGASLRYRFNNRFTLSLDAAKEKTKRRSGMPFARSQRRTHHRLPHQYET